MNNRLTVVSSSSQENIGGVQCSLDLRIFLHVKSAFAFMRRVFTDPMVIGLLVALARVGTGNMLGLKRCKCSQQHNSLALHIRSHHTFLFERQLSTLYSMNALFTICCGLRSNLLSEPEKEKKSCHSARERKR